MSLLRLDNDVFAEYAFYTGALGLKMLMTAWWVGTNRAGKKVFANREDVKMFAGRDGDGDVDEDVERIRRIHLHDLENIPLFAAVGLLYVAADPDPQVALWHFRTFAIARVCHTISYRLGLQPWRALTFVASSGVIISMAVKVLRSAKY